MGAPAVYAAMTSEVWNVNTSLEGRVDPHRVIKELRGSTV